MEWKSYEDAVAAGFSNIKTESEFNRGGKDKETYGTYRAYLENMYGVYVHGMDRNEIILSYNPLGKEGTLARAEAAKSGGMLDAKTRAELEAYVRNSSGNYDDDVVTRSQELLDYWNNVTTGGDGTGGGGTKFRYNESTGVLEVSYDGGVTWESLVSFKGGGYSSGGNAQSAYDAQLKAIEEQRAYAEKLAEQARQEAIKNAYINYDRSLSTYGQNAERLAQMGLSNSGYSDYLGGVAYSSMVGGVQDAHKTANEAIERAYYNASQQKAEAADALYNRQWAEQNEYYNRQYNSQLQAATKFEEILKDINYGEYTTAAQVQTLAKANGFTDDQTNVLVNALNDYLDYIDNANLIGNNENPLKTTVTRSTVGGTTIKETKTENTQSGGYTTVYEITDADGNTKTFATVKGH